MPSHESAWDKVLKPWWAKLAFGVLGLFVAWRTYVDFSRLESGEKKSMLIGNLVGFLYDIGGKGLPVGLFVLFGLGMIGYGIYQFMQENA